MQFHRISFILYLFLSTFSLSAQCEYTLDSYSHNNCYGVNSGSIKITLTHPGATASWVGPNGFSSNSSDINNLFAGKYC